MKKTNRMKKKTKMKKYAVAKSKWAKDFAARGYIAISVDYGEMPLRK